MKLTPQLKNAYDNYKKSLLNVDAKKDELEPLLNALVLRLNLVSDYTGEKITDYEKVWTVEESSYYVLSRNTQNIHRKRI